MIKENLRYKMFGTLLILSSVTAMGYIAQGQTTRESAIMDTFLSQVKIESDEGSFSQEPTSEMGEYSLINGKYEKLSNESSEDIIQISTEKIADPSQRYRTVDEYLYVINNTDIYEEDNTNSKIIRKSEYADYIHKIGNDPYNTDGFSKIEIEGKEAYILTQSLTPNILFKETNQPVYSKEDLKIYNSIKLEQEIGSLNKMNSIIMTGESHDLIRVDYNGHTGYIQKEKISKDMIFNEENKTVWALSDLSLKVKPDVNAEEFKVIYKNAGIKEVGISQEWLKLQIDENTYAYAKISDFTDIKPISKGEEIVSYALQFIGNPYVWGGTSLTNGADCSGFTQAIYSNFGYSLSRTTDTQINEGRSVSYEDAQPGDLIFYSGHVAIYMGDGQIVHASNSAPYPAGGIKTSPATYTTILGIRRIVD